MRNSLFLLVIIVVAAMFISALKNSATPQKAVDFSYTSSRTSSATVTDHEGLARTALIDEVRFENARRVENLAGVQFTGTPALLFQGSIDAHVPGPNSQAPRASRFTQLTVTEGICAWDIGSFQGRDIRVSYWARVNVASGDFTVTIPNFFGGNLAELIGLPPGTAQGEWVRITTPAPVTGTANTYFGCSFSNASASVAIGDWIELAAQVEEVTGQANQNPSEFVSVGAVTGPAAE